MIDPHGGKLINSYLSSDEQQRVIANQYTFRSIMLDREQVKDVQNIGNGVYSPLTGYLRKEDCDSVLTSMRLADGTVWPIPIVLDITSDQAETFEGLSEVLLIDELRKPVALLTDFEIYPYDKKQFAEMVFGTSDQDHPGVEDIYAMEDYLIGGDVGLISYEKNLFPEHNYTPSETRKLFAERGWDEVVAFQTRNVPHRGHEYLQIKALEDVDGLFVQPVIGEKKMEDFKDEYIISSYEILMDKYYPPDKTLLGILPLKMRYAGPKEAVLHAIIRKNFGCSHFIVGRDHAGVGAYYEPFAAQEIFEQFSADDLGVNIVKFQEVVYDKDRQMHAYGYEVPEESKIRFSGTKIRTMIVSKQSPPEYLMRPEVYNLLINSRNTMVDEMYKNEDPANKEGFILWFVGLSGSGKSTVANKVFEVLRERNVKLERLDGDVVRESLTKDLGFSKEDRDENIQRVGFVAQMLARNGVGVLASFISPYREARDRIRKSTKNFIEVFVDTPLEVCEQRDAKGLYEKARSGEIKNFTGISDPFEEPEDPEIVLATHEDTLDESVSKVIKYLEDRGLI